MNKEQKVQNMNVSHHSSNEMLAAVSVEQFIESKSKKAVPKHSSVTSLNKLIGYKKGLSDGINLMKEWAHYYEENKYKTCILNKKTEDELLAEFLNSR